jgi:glycosyltransferase involved in cell wall biosynthesis
VSKNYSYLLFLALLKINILIEMKKRICFIVATPLTAKAFLLKHFEYLSKEFDIYLAANFEENTATPFFSPYVKETKHIGIQRNIALIEDVKALFTLRNYLVQMQFDAVHTVTPKAALLGILGAKMAGVKIRIHIFTGQVWHSKKGIFRTLLKNLDRLIVYCATHILVDGESQRQFLIQNKIIDEKNSRVLGKGSISGVDLGRFSPNTEIRDKYRKELNLSSEVIFMFLGRINLDKGVLDLVQAFLRLNRKYNNSKLVLVGPDEENLQPQIKEMCPESNSLVFYGSTSKPEEVLQLADVFCLPSYREGFGTSVIEASLLELPIICSDTYGLMETILDNKTGLRHQVGNIDSIYNQMEKMMEDDDLRLVLGNNGRNYVLENFSSDAISQEWVTYYTNLLSTKH